MMDGKFVLVFIFPNCMGGVASFNRNLINYTSLKGSCHIRVILLEAIEDTRPKFTDTIDATEIIHFTFSTRENQYSVCKRLSRIIGNEKGCVITDNGLTLNAISLFGSFKRLIYLVHDYFYVNWAIQYQKIIDRVIAHASFFCDVLLAAANVNYHDKVFYLPYGVELPRRDFAKAENQILKLVFLGRLVQEKGVLLLKEIDDHIRGKGVQAEWTIIGKGPLDKTLVDQWSGADNVQFVPAIDTQEVYSILQAQDILVFPSWFEGTPVSIMEGLSRGVVPVVSDLPGGTRDMVTEDTGMRCAVRKASAYADAIHLLYNNKGKLRGMQNACIEKARLKYDINKAADAYFSFFLEQPQSVKKSMREIAQFSTLDKRFLPNWMVYGYRSLKQYLDSGSSK